MFSRRAGRASRRGRRTLWHIDDWHDPANHQPEGIDAGTEYIGRAGARPRSAKHEARAARGGRHRADRSGANPHFDRIHACIDQAFKDKAVYGFLAEYFNASGINRHESKIS